MPQHPMLSLWRFADAATEWKKVPKEHALFLCPYCCLCFSYLSNMCRLRVEVDFVSKPCRTYYFPSFCVLVFLSSLVLISPLKCRERMTSSRVATVCAPLIAWTALSIAACLGSSKRSRTSRLTFDSAYIYIYMYIALSCLGSTAGFGDEQVSNGSRIGVGSVSNRCPIGVELVSNWCRIGVDMVSKWCRISVESVSNRCRISVESVSTPNRSRLQMWFVFHCFPFCSKALLEEDKASDPVFEKVCRSIIVDLFCMKLGTVWNEEPVKEEDISAVISTSRFARVFKLLSPYARTGVEDM